MQWPTCIEFLVNLIYRYVCILQKWRTEHWEKGELATLGLMTGEEGDVELDDDEDNNEEEIQETARQTLAILLSGRTFSDEEILG